MTRLRGARNMSCKVLELYCMDVCLSIFNLVNSSEAMSLIIIGMEGLIDVEIMLCPIQS